MPISVKIWNEAKNWPAGGKSGYVQQRYRDSIPKNLSGEFAMRLAQGVSGRIGSILASGLFACVFLAGGARAESAPNPAPKIEEPGKRCPELDPGELTNDIVADALGVTVERLKNVKLMRDLDLNAVCGMPSGKLLRAFQKAEEPMPDSPGEWAKFRASQQSVNGVVKPDGLYQGFLQRQALLQTQKSVVLPVAGIASGQWTSIGPGNIGGRIRAMAVNPSLTTTVFIGGVAGGIWKSTDSGASWAAVNDFMSNLAISSLVFDPTNSNTIYAGTGEGFFNVDSVRGFGLFKSIDGGTTWSLLAATDPTTSSADWYYVNRVAVSSTGVVLAATKGGVYRSSDGGTTWAKTQASTTGFGVMDVKFDPNNANNAVMGDRQGVVGYSVDAGLSWTMVTLGSAGGFNGRVELAYAASASGTVYASEDISSGSIYKSVNGGATWSLVSAPAHLSGQGWYANTIWVDPTNANHLIVGGLDLKQSADGGATFSSISTWFYAPTSPHADHHIILSDPGYNGSTNRKIYFGNDGGIYRAADISLVNANQSSNGWANLNNGLAITQFYGGAGHAAAGSRIAGGTQDNGSLVYTGSSNWATMFGGDGGYSAADSADGNYFYGEYVYLQIHRSTDGGGSSNYIYSGITDAGSSANFIAPFILDPNNNNRMLGGGASLWESVNVKATTPTWTAKKPSTGSNISAIAVAEGNPDVVWVGHSNGAVYSTTNGTAASPTWTLVRSANSRAALRILIDKDNASLVYVTYGGYAGANVWRTVDAGSTWTDISGVLPQVPIRGFARYPLNANWLYAGTEVGVFASIDGGTTWSAINDGPANICVDELFWFDNATLVAATHGRGMFKTIVSTSFALTVNRAGSGRVTSADAGVDCGATCSANYPSGSAVVLTATPSPGGSFTGWGGACSGTSTCNVTMNAAASVSANFASIVDFPSGGVIPSGWVQPAGSSAAWAATTDSTFSGTYGLRAGAIADSQTSSISYTGVFNAGTVSFARRVSSEGTYDFLNFYIDGVLQGSWAGEVAWGVVSYAITAGTHTVKWEYNKDPGGSSGQDTAWVDEVSLPLVATSTSAPWLDLLLLLTQ